MSAPILGTRRNTCSRPMNQMSMSATVPAVCRSSRAMPWLIITVIAAAAG